MIPCLPSRVQMLEPVDVGTTGRDLSRHGVQTRGVWAQKASLAQLEANISDYQNPGDPQWFGSQIRPDPRCWASSWLARAF